MVSSGGNPFGIDISQSAPYAPRVPRVHVMPDTLASQVAAGEVVERPASVVKELVENSLDAGAREVRLEIQRGGVALVKVADDGCGMNREDALLSLERHATSKLLDKAAGLNKKFAPLYTWRGLVSAELKYYKKALDNFMRSIRLKPDQSILYINISNMFYNIGEYPQAYKWIVKAQDAGEVVDLEYIRVLETELSRNKN